MGLYFMDNNKLIIPPALYYKLKKEGYDMKYYVKSKLIKLRSNNNGQDREK